MKASVILLFCCLSLGGCGHRTHSTSPSRAARRAYEQSARAAAIEWLELLDAQEYEDAYDREPARLREGGSARQFARSMQSRRAPLGRTLSRKWVGAAYTRKLTSAPDGDYESMLFKTSFQHKAVAAERLILVKEDLAWRVVDYRLY